MIQSYQNPINIYIKNNKDLILGFIMGLLLLLTMLKQSVGLPILFIYIIAIGGLIQPSKEYLLIAGLLIIKIIIISIITKNNLHDINIENIKILFRRIIIDVILLFMLFVALKDKTKKGFYYFCIALFVLDFTFNVYAHFTGASIYGVPLEIRPKDLIARSGGLFGHPFYSIDISLVALFCGLLLKNYIVIFFAVVNVLLSGAQRGLVSIGLIALIFLIFQLRVKKISIYTITFIFISGIFFGVSYLADNNPNLLAHNERIFRWEFGYKTVISNLEHLNSYLRFNPEFSTLKSIGIVDFPFNLKEPLFFYNAESHYLTTMVNYGIIIGFISIIIFYYLHILTEVQFKKYALPKYLAPILLSYFIFVDSFYAYSIETTLTTFFYCVFLLNPLKEKRI